MFTGDSEDSRYSKDKSSMELRQTLSRMERNTHKFVRWHSKESKKVEALNFEFFVEERRKYTPWKSEASTNRKFYHFISFFNRHFCEISFFMVSDENQLKISKELRKSLSDLSKGTHAFIRKHDTLANRSEYLQYTDFVKNREK